VLSRQYQFSFTIGSSTFTLTLPGTFNQTSLYPTSESNYLTLVQSAVNSYNFAGQGFSIVSSPSLTSIGQVTFKIKNNDCTYNGTIGTTTFSVINESYIP